MLFSGIPRFAQLPDGRQLRLVYKPLPFGHKRVRLGACRWTTGLAAATGDVDLRPWAPPVMDQGQTGACTGHEGSCCATTAFARAGRPLPFVVSPSELYRNGRRYDQVPRPDGSFFPLEDNGAYISSVTASMNTWGVTAIKAPTADGRYSDADTVTINDEPKLDDALAEAQVIPIGERAIADCSTGRPVDAVLADIRAALAAGYPVGFGAFVATSFMNWDPSQGPIGAQDLADPQGGGHAITVLGITGDSLIVRNSWGESWGDAGNCLVGPAFVAQITDVTSYVPMLEAT